MRLSLGLEPGHHWTGDGANVAAPYLVRPGRRPYSRTMIYLNTGSSARRSITPTSPALDGVDAAVWLDLVAPTDQERSDVERATTLRIPTRAEIAEIESSSRLVTEGDCFYLTTPMSYRDQDGESLVSPLGFVLSPDRLITVRFAEMPVFDTFAERFASLRPSSSAAAFTGLLDTIVDRLADVLEHVGADLEGISKQIFRIERTTEPDANKIDARLRLRLAEIGRAGERLSNLRDSLVGVQRLLVYVHAAGVGWLDAEMLRRCSTLSKDIASLTDYDVQLNNKMQFLLDATLGFINIEQNNGIKVLTVVSVVGVPPTLIASIYGMNFKRIPELQWDYGYLYGLTLIVASAVVPLLWFKRRGWI
ncbi:MAG: magnesium transporter CorA family protein [Pseudomonadota bacterium]|nr:magnesium transporter CorA family protein [Pseudomonadota bacterium]